MHAFWRAMLSGQAPHEVERLLGNVAFECNFDTTTPASVRQRAFDPLWPVSEDDLRRREVDRA